MSRRTKKGSNIKKFIVIGVAAALIGSVLAIVYRPPAPALQTRFIQEFVIPSKNAQPVGITVDNGGKVWFAESGTRKIGMFDPSTKQFEEFPLSEQKTEDISPIASMWHMEFDKNGYLWFPDVITNAIWKFDPYSEAFEVFKIPSAAKDFNTSYPINFHFDDGKIWFSEIYGKNIGVLDTSQAKHNTSEGMEEFSATVELETLGPLAFDKDGNIWFTALTYPISGKLMRFDPNTKEFTTFNMPAGISSPVGIASDNDGNLWINDHGTSAFIKFNPVSNSTTTYVTSLPRPSTSFGLYEKCLTQPNGSPLTCPGAPVSLPYWNTVDKQGRIWFNLHQGNAIAVFDPVTETLVEYFIPTQNPRMGACDGYNPPCGFANTLQFTLAPDGKAWFTEWTEDKIGVLDPRVSLPFRLDVANNDVTISRGETAKIELTVTSNESLNSPVNMRIAGTMNPTGRLFDMTANFSEEALIFDAPSTKPLTLFLTPEEGLKPGEYRITVSAQSYEVTYSKIIRLTVE